MNYEFKVLVCGGRDFGWKYLPTNEKVVNKEEVAFLENKLNIVKKALDEVGKSMVVVQGEANGADNWAKKWAEKNGIKTLDFPADWNQHGKKAGYIRNKQMLDEGKPELVIAFPGGKGTKMMMTLSQQYDIPVKNYNIN